MAREVRHFIHDISNTIRIIDEATAGKSFSDYQGDTILRYGIERAVEIISEASRRLPDALKATRPEVPWPKIRGIGNVLRHEYHGLSDQIIWGVVIDEIPKLRLAIDAIQQTLDEA